MSGERWDIAAMRGEGGCRVVPNEPPRRVRATLFGTFRAVSSTSCVTVVPLRIRQAPVQGPLPYSALPAMFSRTGRIWGARSPRRLFPFSFRPAKETPVVSIIGRKFLTVACGGRTARSLLLPRRVRGEFTATDDDRAVFSGYSQDLSLPGVAGEDCCAVPMRPKSTAEMGGIDGFRAQRVDLTMPAPGELV